VDLAKNAVLKLLQSVLVRPHDLTLKRAPPTYPLCYITSKSATFNAEIFKRGRERGMRLHPQLLRHWITSSFYLNKVFGWLSPNSSFKFFKNFYQKISKFYLENFIKFERKFNSVCTTGISSIIALLADAYAQRRNWWEEEGKCSLAAPMWAPF